MRDDLEQKAQEALRNLATNLRRVREARGLSLQEVARESGLAQVGLGALEEGSAVPDLEIALALRSYFDVSFDILISPAPE